MSSLRVYYKHYNRIHTSPVRRWMISNECLTILTVMSFLPLLRPCIIREQARRSTIGHWALRNLFTENLPALCGRYLLNLSWGIEWYDELITIFQERPCAPWQSNENPHLWTMYKCIWGEMEYNYGAVIQGIQKFNLAPVKQPIR